ncbi:MAG TPA: S8 family serine peptidase, partial [Candidatus Polarisedimenticolaceae bacterium]|nr:S8 family serine peptidase [Candidatus Polarisedimenticolaceae bacterium]
MRFLPLLTLLAAPLVHAGSLAPDLRDALTSATPHDRIPIVVLMEAFPERERMLDQVRGMPPERRRAHVVAALKALAERSQAPVRAVLAGERTRVLWGVNGLALTATPETIARLAALPEVRWVLHDGGRGEPAGGGTPTLTGPTGGDVSGPNPDATIRPEVTAMGAPQVWNQLGYTGAGVIVAVLDTGVWRSHPDLADHIWTNLDEVPGNGVDDDGNGYVDDTWGWDLCNGDNDPSSGTHGTQVAGQVAGDGTNGVVTGMAPDAELMVLGFDCSPPDSIGWEASDYAIANGAHVITESFIWPWEDPPDYEGWRRQTDTELAAGILHLNAAGNDGQNQGLRPVPYNVSAPANCPPPWLHPDQTLLGGISSVVAVANID